MYRSLVSTSRRLALRRGAALASAVVPLALLGGCATLNQMSVEVQSFGQWPAGRAPGTYAFDWLPSQQAAGERLKQVETAAAQALQQAGFQPAAAGTAPDVLVQVGVRIQRSDPAPWDDPLWWPGGFGTWRLAPWRSPLWLSRAQLSSPRYERSVALLLRDRANGQPLLEVHAASDGFSRDLAATAGPLFQAALQGFPAALPSPRTVRVPG